MSLPKGPRHPIKPTDNVSSAIFNAALADTKQVQRNQFQVKCRPLQYVMLLPETIHCRTRKNTAMQRNDVDT